MCMEYSVVGKTVGKQNLIGMEHAAFELYGTSRVVSEASNVKKLGCVFQCIYH